MDEENKDDFLHINLQQIDNRAMDSIGASMISFVSTNTPGITLLFAVYSSACFIVFMLAAGLQKYLKFADFTDIIKFSVYLSFMFVMSIFFALILTACKRTLGNIRKIFPNFAVKEGPVLFVIVTILDLTYIFMTLHETYQIDISFLFGLITFTIYCLVTIVLALIFFNIKNILPKVGIFMTTILLATAGFILCIFFGLNTSRTMALPLKRCSHITLKDKDQIVENSVKIIFELNKATIIRDSKGENTVINNDNVLSVSTIPCPVPP